LAAADAERRPLGRPPTRSYKQRSVKALLVENHWSTAWEKVSSLPPSRLRLIIVGASLLACLSFRC